MRSTQHRFAALAAASVIALLLSGCTMSIVSEGQPAGVQNSQQPAETGDEVDAAPAPSTKEGLERDALIAASTTVQRCDGELTILDDAVAVRVEGPCDRLIVNSSGSIVVADDTAYLSVIGDGNVVLVKATEEVLVNGSSNVVRWQGETPSVNDTGSANVLTEG